MAIRNVKGDTNALPDIILWKNGKTARHKAWDQEANCAFVSYSSDTQMLSYSYSYILCEAFSDRSSSFMHQHEYHFHLKSVRIYTKSLYVLTFFKWNIRYYLICLQEINEDPSNFLNKITITITHLSHIIEITKLFQ